MPSMYTELNKIGGLKEHNYHSKFEPWSTTSLLNDLNLLCGLKISKFWLYWIALPYLLFCISICRTL